MSPKAAERTEAAAMQIDLLRAAPERRDELVALLDEQAALYQGLGTRDAERLRGYVLASFETVGLPREALPFVLEELETGLDPYPVAAAAKALRGAREVPDAAIRALAKALRRITSNNDYVRYDTFALGGASASGTTALDELVRTAGALASRSATLAEAFESANADRDRLPQGPGALDPSRPAEAGPASCGCCGAPEGRLASPVDSEAVAGLLLEDQAGRTFAFDAFFPERPSVLAFFYTRCMNPEKCSLTITKLARLQRLIREAGLEDCVNVAALTYDPAYDGPDRLRAYGAERGMRFDARNKLLRTLGPFEPVRALFNLKVGFGPATVNRHRVEALILDERGRSQRYFAGTQWLETDISQIVISMAGQSAGTRRA